MSEIKTHKWYRVELIDHQTAHLLCLEVTGRRVGKKTVLMESTPFVVMANWRALVETMTW